MRWSFMSAWSSSKYVFIKETSPISWGCYVNIYEQKTYGHTHYHLCYISSGKPFQPEKRSYVLRLFGLYFISKAPVRPYCIVVVVVVVVVFNPHLQKPNQILLVKESVKHMLKRFLFSLLPITHAAIGYDRYPSAVDHSHRNNHLIPG